MEEEEDEEEEEEEKEEKEEGGERIPVVNLNLVVEIRRPKQ